MVAGIDKFLLRQIEQSISERQRFWNRDFSSTDAFEKSVQTNRARLRKMIGAVDARLPMNGLELMASTSTTAIVAENDTFTIQAVRWPVFEGVFGEGLWIKPKGATVARIVAVPDADQTPEMIVGLAPGVAPERQFARRLAENGCEVLVPVLIDRQDTWSGNEHLHRFTNQPHREWIYRQAFELGRHLIGYEVQKILAAIDFFATENQAPSSTRAQPESSLSPSKGERTGLPSKGSATEGPPSEVLLTKEGVRGPNSLPIGIVGSAEGGLIAFYAAALDPRIRAALISGFFDSRQRVWEEPIYRNVFGLLQEFGDAEIATMIAPRTLIIEHSPVPKIDGPPKPREGRSGAAPGKLKTPDYESVEAEFERARTLLKPGDSRFSEHLKFISGAEGMTTGPASDRALAALLNALGVAGEQVKQPGKAPADSRSGFDPAERQRRQVKELENFTQKLFRASARARTEFFWSKIKATTPQEWETACVPFRKTFWEEVIGRLPPSPLAANPRSRSVQLPARSDGQPGGAKTWTPFEIVLDVFPDVFAWGYLLVPNDLKPGERRPVIVCQHGLEGVPADVINDDPNSQGHRYYKAFAARLADQGFVTFAPHNPYRGGDKFRQLQRKANPLGKSLFSIIIAQHERAVDWLAGLPFVDAKRIGFYGLSYGGKTAMRVPAVLEHYALSICSGDFNEWVEKNVSVDFPGSYMFTGEYEMPEWDLGHTFNYAEMAALIAPRPFMVERGHNDGVGIDESVASEYAKVRRLYDQLALPERTTIEFFNGPHTINGIGTFEFLRKNLDWPVSKP